MTFPVENDCGRQINAADSLISNLLHDLRQPLSNIETTVCYLRIALQMSQRGVGAHLDLIEMQVEEADRMLSDAADGLRRLRAQRDLDSAGNPESLDLTNSATAALT
jgi:signal transduction histidine kinase